MKARELSEVFGNIVDFLNKYPDAEVSLGNTLYSDEDDELLDLHAEINGLEDTILLSTN